MNGPQFASFRIAGDQILATAQSSEMFKFVADRVAHGVDPTYVVPQRMRAELHLPDYGPHAGALPLLQCSRSPGDRNRMDAQNSAQSCVRPAKALVRRRRSEVFFR